MPNNPLFRPTNSPTNTTKPTKAVNQIGTKVRLTHNTFDNSYFNFKTQRYGQYEPFWWKPVVAGDNEPYSNSHNVRSLPFASPILSPMKLNKDYFQVPMYAIQPNTWDYIFKAPTQGDDVPFDSQNLFPLQNGNVDSSFSFLDQACALVKSMPVLLGTLTDMSFDDGGGFDAATARVSSQFIFALLILENFLSSGSLLYQLGYKFNPVFYASGKAYSFDQIFDFLVESCDFAFILQFADPDSPSGVKLRYFTTVPFYDVSDFRVYDTLGVEYIVSDSSDLNLVDKFTALSLLRSYVGDIVAVNIAYDTGAYLVDSYSSGFTAIQDGLEDDPSSPLDCIRMDVINAYQLACAQFYVNPRVDFLYNSQLYRDNFIQLLRDLVLNYGSVTGNPSGILNISSFDYNGLPVLYDFFSYHYYNYISVALSDVLLGFNTFSSASDNNIFLFYRDLASIISYLFGFREQLRFGNYFTDSRTQALGYGEPGSDIVQVFDNSVSVTDMSQKLVLERFRGAVAHLDGTTEDYLSTMFHEQLPPDYHYPKFIAHSEFAINGEEISNTTSDNQGNIVTNLKSGQDTAEFNIEVSIPSILIGISYISIPETYSQIKERHYMHADRYDMFQPMLQYFGDQEIYNREVSDLLPNPSDAYSYVSRNGEYKQRLSQVSGAFLTSLRSWIFTVDLPAFGLESSFFRLSNTQSPVAIRAHDYEFNRFLARQTGFSLGTGFHFIMQYNNKNVDNRPMDINPLPLYPNQTL